VRPGTKNAAEKRKKEILRQKWQKEKAERRQQRQSERSGLNPLDPDEDPDIAGIVPGPQPIAEETPATTETQPPAEPEG
jgi:hypothetical protein